MNMREARTKLGYEMNNGHAYSLRDATPHLRGRKFNPEKEYFEFLIKDNVTSDGIKKLLSLKYEIALTEANGRIILSTGVASGTGLEEDYRHRRDNSRTSFHTHPANGRETPVITPSFSDVYLSEFVSDETTLGLAHGDGIMVYRKPAFDPDTNTSRENKKVRDVMLVYCENRGVDVFGRIEGLKKYWDLSDAEKVKLQRKFAEETQMIVDEASWEDQRGLERVLLQIFGRANQ
jgi:hypothetical protein